MAGLRLGRASRWLAAFVHRRAGTIAWVTFLVSLAFGWGASRLTIDQELRRLLPDDFPSVERLERLEGRVGESSDLFVTIHSPSRAANIAFGEALTPRMEAMPEIRHAVFRRDFSFFEERALLYAPLTDLLELRRDVIDRIASEVARSAYGSLESPEADAPEPLEVDPDEIRERYADRDGFEPYLEADEGRLMVIKARPIRPSTDLEFASALASEVHRRVDALEPTSFHPEMTVKLDGAYAQHTGRVRDIRDDVVTGSLAAGFALLLTLVVYFRSARAVLLVFVPLVASVLGALAFAWWWYGFLNLVSAFIFAVLLGLGIDFGIHVLARYRQERARGSDSEAALATTYATSGYTTVAGAMSTALVFASLAVADFQGFAQFGIVAAVGVALALLGALLVMPALVVSMDRISVWKPGAPTAPRPGSRPRGSVVRGFAVAVVILGLAGAVAGAALMPRLSFEHDLSVLGPVRESKGEPSVGYRDAVGKAQTVAPAIALTDDLDQTEVIHRQLEGLLAMTPEQVESFDPSRPPSVRPPRDAPAPAPPDEAAVQGWEDDDFEDLDPFEEPADDPRFERLAAVAERTSILTSEAAAILGTYEPERLATMRDRLAAVSSIYSFIPPQQDLKLQVIRDIERRLAEKRGLLSEATRAELDEWSRQLEVRAPITPDDLPPWVRAPFEDPEGRLGNFVVVYTRGSKADIDNARRIYQAFGTLHAARGSVEVAADFFVLPEIFDAILADGPVVFSLALAIMLGTAWVLVGRLGSAIAVAATVLVALLWLAGLMVGLGWKLHFFNIIVLPLLLGMGQDDALHIVERHREEGSARISLVLRETGGAITVTTVTTVWGFAGILFANHRGLESMARVAVIGMSLALAASVVVLPVLLVAGERLRARMQSSRSSKPAANRDRPCR